MRPTGMLTSACHTCFVAREIRLGTRLAACPLLLEAFALTMYRGGNLCEPLGLVAASRG